MVIPSPSIAECGFPIESPQIVFKSAIRNPQSAIGTIRNGLNVAKPARYNKRIHLREGTDLFSTVEEAIEEIRRGRIVIVVDDEDRENEGDFTMAASKVTPDAINFMATHGRGLICLSMTGDRLDELHLPLMVQGNTSRFMTAFTVSIDALHGVTTGISAADRATTILTAIDPKTTPSDLARPGHIFPLRARPGGVLERAGQTEAGVDLARLAGLKPASVICEVMDQDGSMARVPQLAEVARKHNLKMITVADLIAFRLKTETFVHKVAEATLPTEFGDFRVCVFENSLDHENHIALVRGTIRPDEATLVRVHSQSTMSDVFGSLRSDGAEQLHAALRMINESGAGVLVYLRQEGKGIGLANEVKSYALQDAGADSEEANSSAGSKVDLRVYGIGAQILTQLGVRKLRLLTNHPKKIIGLQGYGLSVVEQLPPEIATSKPARRKRN
jgi:3,4-dihydroxy 2-butanone 4-phosphate synthase/GTP cyclohydrolase II